MKGAPSNIKVPGRSCLAFLLSKTRYVPRARRRQAATYKALLDMARSRSVFTRLVIIGKLCRHLWFLVSQGNLPCPIRDILGASKRHGFCVSVRSYASVPLTLQIQNTNRPRIHSWQDTAEVYFRGGLALTKPRVISLC